MFRIPILKAKLFWYNKNRNKKNTMSYYWTGHYTNEVTNVFSFSPSNIPMKLPSLWTWERTRSMVGLIARVTQRTGRRARAWASGSRTPVLTVRTITPHCLANTRMHSFCYRTIQKKTYVVQVRNVQKVFRILIWHSHIVHWNKTRSLAGWYILYFTDLLQ